MLTGEEFKGSLTCSWKIVTVRNEVTGSLDGRLAIRVYDWVAAAWTMKVPGTLDKFSKLMNRMERSRFP